jgi:short subunit dehydrogenase-like uncharacterized protein
MTHDIVLWGASGFTGRLVAEYLLLHGPPDLRLALAGRNRAKLEAVRDELARRSDRVRELPILIGDAGDEASVAAIVSSARVVCTTVGPYAKYGQAMVAACARLGVHYCDLTGEVAFMRQTIDRHQETARASGARIVHACGFDSIPSDLGVFLVAHHLRQEHGVGLARDDAYFGESKGAFSGGTIDTMLVAVKEMKSDAQARRLAGDPYALVPDREADRGPSSPDQRKVAYSEDLGRWTAPFLMAAVNTRVVRRSNVLLGGYGAGFRYSETMSTGRGAKGMLAAQAITAALGGFFGALWFAPTRAVVARFLPSPGDGPSQARRDAGFFVTRHVGTSEPDANGQRHRVLLTIEGTSDPGYGETAKMIGEAALCLARDPLPSAGGVTTPAVAMGMHLVDRLRAAGMTWKVEPFTTPRS